MAKHLVICGHGKNPNGSHDPGAMGPSGTEADWVRRLARVMAKYNQTDIDYITEQNVYEYRNIATYSGYDTITELHLNAYNGQAKGCEVLIWHECDPDALDNKLLAILANYFVNRGIKKYDLYNMRICAEKGYNYRLVECCFVDNASDMNIFTKSLDEIAKQFVEAITGQGILKEIDQTVMQSQGTRTLDDYPSAFKELLEQDVVEVCQQATHYQNGQEISPYVKGQKYVITGKMDVQQSHSKHAYRLAQNGVAIGWVLEQDIVEAWQLGEDREFVINGKSYRVVEK